MRLIRGVQGGACCVCFYHHLLGHDVSRKYGHRSLDDEIDILRALTQIQVNIGRISSTSDPVECKTIWTESEALVHSIADKSVKFALSTLKFSQTTC